MWTHARHPRLLKPNPTECRLVACLRPHRRSPLCWQPHLQGVKDVRHVLGPGQPARQRRYKEAAGEHKELVGRACVVGAGVCWCNSR